MRLAKYIADQGYCSRRKAEALIAQGAVTLNSEIAQITTPVDPEKDRIAISGQLLQPQKKVYILLNKPTGYLCTCKPGREAGNTILELVNIPQRIYPVGRLDQDTSGLILLTNDGAFAYALTHPSHQIEKEYIVEINSSLSAREEQLLLRGLSLNGKRANFHKVVQIRNHTYSIILIQGINRQIRRMMKSIGKVVVKLERVRIGDLKLANLYPAEWRYLTETEIKYFKNRSYKWKEHHYCSLPW